MLTELKIISKKRFRLLKSIMEENFKLPFDSNSSNVDNLVAMQPVLPVEPQVQEVVQPLPLDNEISTAFLTSGSFGSKRRPRSPRSPAPPTMPFIATG